MKKILICGVGGFIVGHLVSHFIKNTDFQIVCADIKSLNFGFNLMTN